VATLLRPVFEREATARPRALMRDRSATSRLEPRQPRPFNVGQPKKGMWMGGLPSYGCQAKNRKLVVHNVSCICAESLPTFPRSARDRTDSLGTEAGCPRDRSDKKHLWRMPNNSPYTGEAVHKSGSYQGDSVPSWRGTSWKRPGWQVEAGIR